jgi:hypothetical protein
VILRLLTSVILVLLSGCTGVPAAVIWTTTGAALGATGAALRLDTEIFRAWEVRHPPQPAANKR